MKKILKIVVVLFAGFGAAQFIRPVRTSPPIIEAETMESSSTQIPKDIETILERSCNDCHTNSTTYPWYSNITPFNWLVVKHVEDGRGYLNFSVWNTYRTVRKRRKLDQICEFVEEREMPLPSYLWIHGSAELSETEIKVLCEWADTEKARLAETP